MKSERKLESVDLIYKLLTGVINGLVSLRRKFYTGMDLKCEHCGTHTCDTGGPAEIQHNQYLDEIKYSVCKQCGIETCWKIENGKWIWLGSRKNAYPEEI